MLTSSNLDLIAKTYRSLSSDPGFRERPTQKVMIRDVAVVFSQPVPESRTTDGPPVRPLLIEAPTGTGKSLAYLAGSVPLALEEGMHVVVSTGTVALQEQLVNRDIPRFLQRTGLKADVAIAKGRGRYLCLRSLETALSAVTQHDMFGADPDVLDAGGGLRNDFEGLDDADRGRLHELYEQFTSSRWDGDLDGLAEPVPARLRPMVTTTAAACAGGACPHKARCPLLKARDQAKSATIVVTNHDLLLEDLGHPLGGGAFLPDPEKAYYVLDEGHHLEYKARERAAVNIRLEGLSRLVELARRLGQQSQRLPVNEPGVWAKSWGHAVGTAQYGVVEFTRQVSSLGEDLVRAARGRRFEHSEQDEVLVRFPFGALPAEVREVSGYLRECVKPLEDLSETLVRRIRAKSSNEVDHGTAVLVGRVLELSATVRQLATSWADSPAPGETVPPEEVVARWISRSPGGQLQVHACQASGGRLLERLMWSRGVRAVVTSATLSEAGNFCRVASELGLYARPHWTRALPSPFRLEEQAELVVPAMRNDPSRVDGFTAEVTDWLATALQETTVATLVLFTSRAMMLKVRKGLPEELRKAVLCQDDASTDAVLRRHAKRVAEGRRAVLFGLASFAEGIDLPGDLCRQVVIVKLPFAVPDDPIEATLAEALEAAGRNPFLERTVPESIRKLVQACGRLIRAESDSGRIVILDRRLLDRAYGQRILAALPPYRRVLGGART